MKRCKSNSPNSSTLPAPDEIKITVLDFKESFDSFKKYSSTYSAKNQKPEKQEKIQQVISSFGETSVDFLRHVKESYLHPDDTTLTEKLSSEIRGLTEGLNVVVNACELAKPGDRECQAILQATQVLHQKLENNNDLFAEMSEYSTLNAITNEKAKS